MTITSHLFEAYLKCPTKCWLRSQGEACEENAYAHWVWTQNESYRNEGTKRLLEGVPQNERVIAPPVPQNPKSAKWRLAVDLMTQTRNLESRLHGVERVPSEGRGKPAQFIPIRFVFTNKVSKDDRLLLAFDVLVFSEVLGREVSLGRIIHGDDHATLKVKTSGLMGEVRNRVERMRALLSGSSPPDLVLNRHCSECESQARCRQKALEKDDLSLLAGMSEKERARHRSKGIFTVTQLSYTFRPRRTPKRAKNPAKPHHFALQALAIRENTIYIHGTPGLPKCKSQIYLDIEGLPDRDFYYLIGALLVTDGQEVFHSFWADTLAEQGTIFSQLAESVSGLPDFRVFHFGDYDTMALKKIAAFLPEAHCGLEAILHRSVNVLSLVHPHVYFPTYSNSLKEIGKRLGSENLKLETTGLQSIIWRTEWETERKAEWKAKLVDYNRTDCLSLRKLTEFILSNTASSTSSEENGAKVKHTDEVYKARPRWRMFTRKDYALDDLRHINKCGYFDYQREKVFLKTHKHFRKISDGRRNEKRHNLRPNKTVDVVRNKCPACMAKNLQTETSRSRYSLNLKFTRFGVKRAVTCTRCWDYRCLGCGGTSTARHRFATRQTYGHNLMSWCVYFNVVAGLSMLKVQKCLEDIFGLGVENHRLYDFKGHIAASYLSLDNELLEAIVKSPVVHIDETTANLRDQSGYVWVVTTMEMVHFFYRPSREASFLTELLAGFAGILVSDFFAGYDMLPCSQQKCLVHVVRELDDDLVHNPFNDQFKVLAQGFGSLLRPIIETIDRYGLRRRYLAKHKREVDRFLKLIEALRPNSELVEKYRNRFLKYWPKMFTFLDFNGVPWNNNNAEHAIKRFAKYRRNADGCYTERSLKEYLVLASVLETCEFNKVNVLKFLLSRETTLEGLMRMAGHKT